MSRVLRALEGMINSLRWVHTFKFVRRISSGILLCWFEPLKRVTFLRFELVKVAMSLQK